MDKSKALSRYLELEDCLAIVRKQYKNDPDKLVASEESILKDMCVEWDKMPPQEQSNTILERAQTLKDAQKELVLSLSELKEALSRK
jgi:hypothetical protein